MGGLLTTAAQAHGDLTPLRGGQVAWAQELSVELVQNRGNVCIWVDDHGTPVSVAGASASVDLVDTDGQVQRIELVPDERSNCLAAATIETLKNGLRMVIVFKLATGQVGMARIVFGAAAASAMAARFAPP